MIRHLALLVTVLAALASASSASAQEARAHFLRGQAAYDTGDYDTAVREWQRAYSLDARPLLQYNLAQAFERLGQLQEAVDAYEAYINAAEDDRGRMSAARARIAALRERLSQTSIRLSGGPEGARILIDGEDRGRLPHPDPLRVEPGSHRVVIQMQGFQDFVATIAVSAGQSVEVPVEMTSGGASAGGGGDGGISTVGVIVAAAGGAILVGGAVTGGLALASADSAQSADDENADTARTLALVTDVLLPVGAAAAITGVLLMFVLPSEEGGGSARVVPVVGPDYAGISIGGTL